jgi:hypothetical protein
MSGFKQICHEHTYLSILPRWGFFSATWGRLWGAAGVAELARVQRRAMRQPGIRPMACIFSRHQSPKSLASSIAEYFSLMRAGMHFLSVDAPFVLPFVALARLDDTCVRN